MQRKKVEREDLAQSGPYGALGEACKISHEPARTRGNTHQGMKKSPARLSWGLGIGGGA